MKYDIAVVGLGVMGRNLALNIESRGYSVAGFDIDEGNRQATADRWADKQRMAVFPTLAETATALDLPRRMLVMVPAGKPVDAVLEELKQLLAGGDVVIDGGNSFFQDTERRGRELDAAGIRYLGCGVSGGEEGALHGPALMPGGQEEAYRLVEPILTTIAAKSDSGSCCGYIGRGGAGHYVKMVHNGIEYGIMQLISEVYDLMKTVLGMSAAETRDVFARWNEGELNSYLIEIAATVLGKQDPETGKPVVDLILDKAGQKGTGKWTSQNALDLGVAVPTINAALEARILSAIKDERVEASKHLAASVPEFTGDRENLLAALHDALRLAILTSYAQGFALLREASSEYGYSLDLQETARIWKGGCIIRARVLDPIREAFGGNAELPNLLTHSQFRPVALALEGRLREVVATAVEHGVPCLALAASLGYLDSYRSERLPANMIQGLRDCFGAHTYERVDRPRGEKFHTEWQ